MGTPEPNARGRRRDLITFTSDFGLRDVFVGVCHAVLAGAAPHARVIDLTHAVDRGDVRHGAVLLARAVAHTPTAVHLAVVDPGVGGARRGIAVGTARSDVLVGPDNGLLLAAAEVLGGVVAVRELSAPGLVREPASSTFHGRDLFAPAAAAVASGTRLEDLGAPIDDPVELAPPRVTVERTVVVAEVVLVDRFGNLQLAAAGDTLDRLGVHIGDAAEVHPGDRPARRARRVRTFVELEPGGLGVHVDSDGMLALAVRGGSAAEQLGIGRGEIVRVGPASDERV